MSVSEIVKEGFLVKKGHMRHNWRTRWFILTKCELNYYKKREDGAPAGVIPLVGATLQCPPPETAKKPWLLQLSTYEHKKFLIQAPDQVMRDEWRLAIEDCIRRLDPTKLGADDSKTRTFSNPDKNSSHSVGFSANILPLRAVVEAMQDPDAGVKLYELKSKGAKHNTLYYFVGKEALDWLVSWSFASSKSEAITLASSLLRHGFFQPVSIDDGKSSSLASDALLSKQFVDSEDAKYVFVVFAPRQSLGLFHSDGENSDDSDSEDDLLSARAQFMNGVDLGDGRILKQGFLLKKGHMRHNWKPRKFVLKDKCPYLYYYKGSKSVKALGTIPLKGLTALELDDEEREQQQQQSQHVLERRKTRVRSKTNRLLLITATGVRYVLEATSSEERNSWIAEMRIAVASQDITPQ